MNSIVIMNFLQLPKVYKQLVQLYLIFDIQFIPVIVLLATLAKKWPTLNEVSSLISDVFPVIVPLAILAKK